MKPIIWWSVGIVLGALAAFGSLVGGVLPDPPSQVMCGDEVMTPADTCEQKSSGSHSTYSYEEMKSKNASDSKIGGAVGTAAGLGLMGLSAVRLVMAARRRRAGPSPVMAAAAQAQQWAQFPPQQYPQPPYQQQPQVPQYQPQQHYQPQQQYQQPHSQPPQNFGPNGS